MERLIMCEICLKYFSDVRIPRVLNCGHSICSPCLSPIVQHGLTSCQCPLVHTGIDLSESMYFTYVKQIPRNYTLESLVLLVKKHLGIECNSKKVKKNNEKEALLDLCKNVTDEELREKLEKEIEERINKGVKEEKAKIMKWKIKLENQNKVKVKRLEASKALMREELNNLKKLRKRDKSEVDQLKHENKRLQLQKVTQCGNIIEEINLEEEINPSNEINIQSQRKGKRKRSNEKIHDCRIKSFSPIEEINLVGETNPSDGTNMQSRRKGERKRSNEKIYPCSTISSNSIEEINLVEEANQSDGTIIQLQTEGERSKEKMYPCRTISSNLIKEKKLVEVTDPSDEINNGVKTSIKEIIID